MNLLPRIMALIQKNALFLSKANFFGRRNRGGRDHVDGSRIEIVIDRGESVDLFFFFLFFPFCLLIPVSHLLDVREDLAQARHRRCADARICNYCSTLEARCSS